MSLVKEFREFAVKGNAIDLAVGVIIGAAFGKVVSSIVDDLLMPPLGMLMGNHDFSDYFITLSRGHYDTLAQAKAAGAATLNYGVFINTLVAFLIVAFAVFLVVKQINRLRRPMEGQPEAPVTRDCPQCLSPVPKAAKRCRYCAEALEPMRAGAPA